MKMGINMGQQKIYLTSRGLNTKLGRSIIGEALSDCVRKDSYDYHRRVRY